MNAIAFDKRGELPELELARPPRWSTTYRRGADGRETVADGHGSAGAALGLVTLIHAGACGSGAIAVLVAELVEGLPRSPAGPALDPRPRRARGRPSRSWPGCWRRGRRPSCGLMNSRRRSALPSPRAWTPGGAHLNTRRVDLNSSGRCERQPSRANRRRRQPYRRPKGEQHENPHRSRGRHRRHRPAHPRAGRPTSQRATPRPDEPPSTTTTDEPAEDTSLLLSKGRVAHHVDTAAGTTATEAKPSPHVSPATVERLFAACVSGAPRSPDAHERTVANCRESASAVTSVTMSTKADVGLDAPCSPGAGAGGHACRGGVTTGNAGSSR